MRISLGINILEKRHDEYNQVRSDLVKIQKEMLVISEYHHELAETITYLDNAMEHIRYDISILGDHG